MSRFVPYGKQSITDDDINAVITTLKADYITQGPKIDEFEKELAQYCNAKYAVVYNSGTSALHGAYFALGVTKDDEFITSPNTFVATSNAGLYLGAKPIFADIEESTGNIDYKKIKEKITPKTTLITPVHYAGHPANMEEIRKIANEFNLAIVEDACHALGAKYKDTQIGSCTYSDMTILSFHPVKHITTGEGGAILTNNSELYEKLIKFRTHGITKQNFINEPHGDWYYEMQELGYNYRMTDIQAALGISQLSRIDSFVSRRREIANIYKQNFTQNEYFDIPEEHNYAYSSYHLYPIRLKSRFKSKKKEFFTALRHNGIGVQVHYMPVYLQPYYQNLGYNPGLCLISEDFYQKEISIPMFPTMTDEDINYVINTIYAVAKEVL
jgi:UDP-4-amino-4,6-dideoxy-N-acetyl-beta-L-altrosamine transaminase